MRRALLFVLLAVLGLQAQTQRARFASGYMYSYYVPQSASTPWRPAWSPDGKEIAFGMSGSLWKIRPGETTAYELTVNKTYDSSPAWSPDGRFIVYTAEDSEGVNLALLNVATLESTQLTRGADIYADPVFSPDGRSIAFVRGIQNPSRARRAPAAAGAGEEQQPRGYQIYTMPFDNGKAGRPTEITAENSFGRARLYFSAYDDHISPDWSPNGKEMMVVSNRGIPLGSGAIWRIPVQPNAMAKAKMVLREETLYRTQPQWSPDGKRILYSSHRGSQYDNLYVLPADGGEPYQMTFGDWDHFDPRWSPDGERIAYISNRHGISELHILRSFGGEDDTVEIKRRAYRRPMGTLEVRIQGAARFYLTGADGKTYTPPSAYQRVAARASRRDFFHAEDRFIVDLPVGEASLEAAKGIEYYPLSKKVDIRQDQVTIVEVNPRRMTSMNAAGWWSASDHVHMNYGGNLHNTPENLMMMARAEDLDVVGDKICNKDQRIFDHQYFTGKPHPLTGSEQILMFGEEYRPPFYGHINLINLTKHLISPFTTGYEGSAIESLYPSNTDIFRVARKEGAIGGYVHPWSSDPKSAGYSVARGFPVDLALGTFEYLEVMTSAGHFKWSAPVWHRALNCGFKITASAGEDSILGLHATSILGSSRLYAYIGDKLEWPSYMEAIRRGRTFVTNGPLLTFTVDGRIAGGEIHLPEQGGTVELNAGVQSIVPIEKLEVFLNGKVIESSNGAPIRKRISIDRSSWITVRASNSKPLEPIDDSYIVAETSPVYVYTGSRKIRSKEDAEYFIEWIDGITQQAQAHPGWRSERERSHVLEQFQQARKIFEERARESQ
ncbi:MAG: CehA/McbA family metallohydrolase [Bryobacterales bacterium]|nr:CehA/McbA family metallohydrolase [Bryobacterales bacterium]